MTDPTDYPLTKKCAEPSCKESATWRYETRRDMLSSYELKHEWRCIRHTRPEELLSPTNPQREVVMVSAASVQGSSKLFWGSNGFQHGPGFKAFADDFPPGTKLIVTARIELP